jgi:threonine aldolase
MRARQSGERDGEGIDLRSDNEAPVAPEIMAAIEAANRGPAASYGDDAFSQRLPQTFRALFETDLAVFPVPTGTAANALSIAQLAPPYGAVFCHEHAHLNTDECGAPEFFSGGAKLVPVGGAHGRIDAGALGSALEALDMHDDHQVRPAALSLSQSTECGTVYRLGEIRQLTAVARESKLRVHMDGARLANAVECLGCSPADATWRAGIDLLSFGATKNGALAAEAVVIFDRDLAAELGRRRKRAGHLLSKMRYVSAQLEAYVADGLWLRLAGRANRAAAKLAEGLQAIDGVELAHPVEANEIFAQMPRALAEGLEKAGVAFLPWPGARDLYRLVASYCTGDEAVERTLEHAARLAREAG